MLCGGRSKVLVNPRSAVESQNSESADAPFDLAAIAAESGIAALEYQPEAGSTNDWALQLASDHERQWPLLVLTARQTGGRGRGSNPWWSAPGALTFSLVVDARASTLEPARWPLLALASGLAVCEALCDLYPSGIFGLKWPNDVYLSSRKLCGILVEAPSQVGRVVIGVGINVNNSFASAPEALQQSALSLADAAGGPFDLSATLISVVQRMLAAIADLTRGTQLAERFSRYCLLTGRNVLIETSRERKAGRCHGIDDEGRLLVQTSRGLERIVAGSVVSWE